MTRPLLSVERVEAGYGEVRVLRGCSMEVRAGELVALVGPNGAGKSTLLKTIVGLLSASAGSIHFEGERIDGLPPYAVARRGIVLVPEGRRLFGPLTVRDNLELGAFLPRAQRQRAESLSRVFRLFPLLEEKAAAPAEVLSGGEQQMLALGLGLMARPRLLCLDDPFLGLAGPITRGVSEALREIGAEGTTILAAGQHVRRLLRLAHRAYLLEEGQVALSGPGAELLADERLRRSLVV